MVRTTFFFITRAGERSGMTGYVQVYTGDGKGKTTAALGLALRAAGAGIKVFLARFLKTGDSSELAALERFADLVTVRSYGRAGFIRGEPGPEDIERARAGFAEVRDVVVSGAYPLVILDEVNVAVSLGLLSVEEVLALIEERPGHVELVLTGRKVDSHIIGRADLVTEMREVKHYYHAGVSARKGIDV
jgi:cob(I)alamin adenosyltransferase